MNRILIIEDEQSLRESLTDYLEQLGYEVIPTGGYCEALKVLDQYAYDCMLVDLNLPDGDGLKIIKLVRENDSPSGILIISARDTVAERIEGLDAGADDYLVKPFHLAEMSARVQSIIRRVYFDGEMKITYNDMELVPDQKLIRSNQGHLELTPKELKILSYFFANKNRIISKESLVEHIWGEEAYGVGNYDPMYTHIKNLRKKLHDLTGKDVLRTVYGVGYKLSNER